MVRFLFILITLSSALTVFGQEFTASVNKSTVAVGEHFKVEFKTELGGASFTPPSFKNLHVLSGPNMAESSMNINGKKSRSFTVSYILRPKAEGKAIIGEASLTSNGKTYQSEPIEVLVTKAKAKANAPNKQNISGNSKATNTDDLSTKVFLKLFVDNKSPYVGEQIVATYKIYTAEQVVNYTPTRPVYNGFYANELEINNAAEVEREYINGQAFTVATLKRVLLTPQKSGEIEIAPLEMDLRIRILQQSRKRGFWGSVFPEYKDVSLDVSSNKEIVKVKPLPTQKQPKGFEGAVGSFNISAEVDRTNLKANEAVNYTVTISGNGNIDLISDPEIEFPVDFEVYDPKVKKNISHNAAGSAGKKTFEYVLIPRFGGEFDLPGVELSYFDPQDQSFKTKSSKSYTLNVLQGDKSEANASGFVPASKEDVQIVGRDIRYIKTGNPNLNRAEEIFFGKKSYYLTIVGLGIAAAATWFIILFLRRKDSGIDVRSKKAGSMAKKHLKSAESLINSGTNDFYDAIAKALYGYLSDKLEIDQSDLNRERVDEELKAKQVSEDLRSELKKALDECDMVRFAPGVVRGKDEMLASSKNIIERLEDEV